MLKINKGNNDDDDDNNYIGRERATTRKDNRLTVPLILDLVAIFLRMNNPSWSIFSRHLHRRYRGHAVVVTLSSPSDVSGGNQAGQPDAAGG